MAAPGLGFIRNHRVSSASLITFAVSGFLVTISQFALSLVPTFCDASSLPTMLAASGFLLIGMVVIGRMFRRLLRVSASASAMVFLNIFFMFVVYTVVIRRGVHYLMTAALYAEGALLIVGLSRILHGDPGYVMYESEGLLSNGECIVTEDSNSLEDLAPLTRARYCKRCKMYVKGFDHHCPAFGNCIGTKNHRLFMLLLVGFLISEILYVQSACQFVSTIPNVLGTSMQMYLCRNLVIGTMLFSILQILWQVVFLMWHVYCICLNIKTDEWINWTMYSEFHRDLQSQTDEFQQKEFHNPYDKGVLVNILEFLKGHS